MTIRRVDNLFKNTVEDIHELRQFLSYDPLSGVFTWKKKRSGRCCIGSAAGNLQPDGYIKIQVLGRRYGAHRLAWAFGHGRWPVDLIDHKNGNTRDNRLSNLREADGSQNRANSGLNSRNSSGIKGVYWCKSSRKWRAEICVRGSTHRLGCFLDKSAAAAAYSDAAVRFFGEFARPSC